MGPRDVLNKLKWGGEDELQSSRVTILHRGAPNDERVIKGSDILELGRGFMRVASPEGEVEIPYHRILRIEAHGRMLWEKRG
ncbi:MAG: RNA repair domain-containing protein [Hadesarchaea archaeon]|nr:RNA repair domain-containing protein [Hadesarchaea archaeon]